MTTHKHPYLAKLFIHIRQAYNSNIGPLLLVPHITPPQPLLLPPAGYNLKNVKDVISIIIIRSEELHNIWINFHVESHANITMLLSSQLGLPPCLIEKPH